MLTIVYQDKFGLRLPRLSSYDYCGGTAQAWGKKGLSITVNFYKRLKDDRKTPEAMFIFDVLSQPQYFDFIQSGGYYFWDPLAAAILTENSLAVFETRAVTILEEEGNQSGQTQTSESGAPVRLAVDVDAERFDQLFLDTLNTPEK